MMDEIEIERQMRETKKRNIRRHHNRLMDALQAEIEQEKINEEKFLRGFDKEEGAKELKKERKKKKDSKAGGGKLKSKFFTGGTVNPSFGGEFDDR